MIEWSPWIKVNIPGGGAVYFPVRNGIAIPAKNENKELGIIELEKEDILPEPKKQWRNKYCSDVEFRNSLGYWVGPSAFWGNFEWPSKEIAEQKAFEDCQGDYMKEVGLFHLGAFDEGW